MLWETKMKLTGRTVLITGGSSGIGLALAEALLARGNVVIVTGRRKEALEAAKRQHPDLHIYASDAADPDCIRNLHDTLIPRFPALDILVNNAGIMRALRLIEDRPLTEVTQEIDVNLSASIRMVQQFLPHLRSQTEAMIINISSGLAFVPFTLSPIYSAAKAGIHAYTRCLRQQLRDTSAKVIEVAPPLTETPLFETEFKQHMPGQSGMSVHQMVGHMIRGIEAGHDEIRPGQSNILKIANRLAPELIFRQLAKVGGLG